MEFIDLQTVTDALSENDKKNYVIDRVKIYGQIVKEMPRPLNIASNVRTEQGGKFAEFKLFGVNLSYHARVLEEVYHTDSKDYIYMINGSILVYVPENKIGSKEFVEISGKIAQGKACEDYFSLLTWSKDEKGWCIKPSKVMKMMLLEWDESTEHYFYANKSIKEGKIIQPEEVKEQVEIFAYENNRRFKVKENETSQNLDIDLTDIPVINSNKVVFNKENRAEIKEYSELAKTLNDLLEKSNKQRNRFIESLRKDYKYDGSCNEYLTRMIDNLFKFLKNKPNIAAMTGRAIVKKYLESFGKDAFKEYLGVNVSNFLADDFEEIREFIKDNTSLLSFDGYAWDLCKLAFVDREQLYAGLLAVIIGKNPQDFIDIAIKLKEYNLSFTKIVNINPYILQIATNMSFTQVEYIALCMGKANDMQLELYRDIALLHDYITDINNGSTVYTINQIKYVTTIGVKLTKVQYDKCVKYSTYLSDTIGNNIVYYVDSAISPFYDVSQFRGYGAYYYKSMVNNLKDIAIDNYIRSGMGVKFNNYITDTSLLEKELYVYDFMYKIGRRKTDYDINEIDKYIAEFEQIKGFALEEKQRKAVELLVVSGACIAGGAGSGKTTTSDCFVYVLSKIDPVKEVRFGAPTGKAAKRMQEVLHKEVPTLHREFKLGLVSDESIFEENVEQVDNSNIIYLFDESAMINIVLLYNIVKRLNPKTASIYLFGDFNQLPPIGKGLPFRNLLRFMPCVFLEVSKRAKQGSTITLNADFVNECSDSDNWTWLENSGDFRLVPSASENIQKIVSGICKHYLGKSTKYEDNTILSFMGMKEFPVLDNIKPDDIQVVSPIGKANYSWGTTQLNKILQPIFNSDGKYSTTFCYYYNEDYYIKYIIGDRVIHTETNNYGMQWYCSYKDGEFHKMYGYGISNGEVGKIVGIVKSSNAKFYAEDGEKPESFQYPSNMRRDESYDNQDGYFVVVEYTDYLTDRNFYILYRAELANKDNNIGIALKGEDLGHIALFYAGTIHKLQGSQAKLIIGVLDYNDKLKTFLSRNMMYTIMTRAQDFEFFIGSVDNTKNSMLSMARTVQAESGISTIGELLYE